MPDPPMLPPRPRSLCTTHFCLPAPAQAPIRRRPSVAAAGAPCCQVSFFCISPDTAPTARCDVFAVINCHSTRSAMLPVHTPCNTAELEAIEGFQLDESPQPPPELDSMPDHGGCECAAGVCQRGACPCASAVLSRDAQGFLIVAATTEPAEMELTECGPSCSCSGACGLGFSAARGRRQPAVSRSRHSGKGWGVYSDEALPAGLLLGQYSGEYISSAEAQQRLREYDAAGSGHALLVRLPPVGCCALPRADAAATGCSMLDACHVPCGLLLRRPALLHNLQVMREWLPSGTAAMRVNIDATRRGNLLGRCLNHSCDGGNLRLLLGRCVALLLADKRSCLLLCSSCCITLVLGRLSTSAHPTCTAASPAGARAACCRGCCWQPPAQSWLVRS